MKQYILVNLLPYREIERREQKKQLGILSAFSVILGGFIVSLIAGVYSSQIDNQMERNKYLENENAKLQTQITKIKDLKDKLKVVLARKAVVEELQITRADGVNLLNTIVQKMPDSMYLKSFKQVGNKITLVGITQSNAKVSGFMRSLEDSGFSTNPQLVEIKSIAAAAPVRGAKPASTNNNNAAVKDEVSEFTLTFDILRKQSDEPKTLKDKKAARAKEAKEKNNTKTTAITSPEASSAPNNKK